MSKPLTEEDLQKLILEAKTRDIPIYIVVPRSGVDVHVRYLCAKSVLEQGRLHYKYSGGISDITFVHYRFYTNFWQAWADCCRIRSKSPGVNRG